MKLWILVTNSPISLTFLIVDAKFRMWRNEVSMKKRERMRQQALELRQMQKLFLLKAMSSPGENMKGHDLIFFFFQNLKKFVNAFASFGTS